jgi:hypothetical protein
VKWVEARGLRGNPVQVEFEDAAVWHTVVARGVDAAYGGT